MESNQDMMVNGAAAGGGLLLLLIMLVIGLAAHLFVSYCFKRICEKCGEDPGILVWIPILQLIPLLQAADLPVWMIVLFLIPFINFLLAIFMWVKICQARNKGPLTMIAVILIPIIGVPYLAFSE